MTSTLHPKVVVSILNWNGINLTISCVKALLADNYPNLQIIVLDNGSTTNEATQLTTTFEDDNVLVYRSEENLGFAGGHNHVVQTLLPAEYDYCLLLNQDALVEEQCVSQLVEYMESAPTCAVAGPTVLEADGNTIQSIGATISLVTGKVTSRHQGAHSSDIPYQEPSSVDCIIGNCFMMRKSAIESIGVFDEDYFAYYEEADWCIRAATANLTCDVVPSALVRHSKSGGFRPYYIARNMVWFVHKFATPVQKLQFAFYYWCIFIPERIKKGSSISQLFRGAKDGWLKLRKGQSQ